MVNLEKKLIFRICINQIKLTNPLIKNDAKYEENKNF